MDTFSPEGEMLRLMKSEDRSRWPNEKTKRLDWRLCYSARIFENRLENTHCTGGVHGRNIGVTLRDVSVDRRLSICIGIPGREAPRTIDK